MQPVEPTNAGQHTVQPIVIQTTGVAEIPGKKKYEGLRAKSIMTLGIIQITVGVLCIILSIAGIVIHVLLREAGHPIWIGVIYIVAGAFGIIAGRKKTICPIITFMVMSIVASAFTVPLLVMEVIGVSVISEEYNHHYRYHKDINGIHHYFTSKEMLAERKTVHVLLVVMALLEGIVSIISSALCCQAVCCGRTATNEAMIASTGQTLQYVTQPNVQGQIILIQNPGPGRAGPSNSQYGPGTYSGYPQGSQQFQDQPPTYNSLSQPGYYGSDEKKKPLDDI